MTKTNSNIVRVRALAADASVTTPALVRVHAIRQHDEPRQRASSIEDLERMASEAPDAGDHDVGTRAAWRCRAMLERMVLTGRVLAQPQPKTAADLFQRLGPGFKREGVFGRPYASEATVAAFVDTLHRLPR